MWLIEENAYNVLADARKHLKPTQEQIDTYQAETTLALAGDSSRVLTTAGDKAAIRIVGALTNQPDIFSMLFGGGNVTYPELVQALQEADADPEITEIILDVDSPGGEVDGLFDLFAQIEATETPITARVIGTAASAAYGIVALADKIVATNRAASVGSIGTATRRFVDPDVLTFTSTEAPNKRPDPTTEAGKKAIVAELDAYHELFVESIAAGRNTTVETVNAEFGRGSMLLAGQALGVGMIDEIAAVALSSVKITKKSTTADTGGDIIEASTTMDKSEFKTKHSALHAEIVSEATEAAVNTERNRVSAFIVAGSQSGDMKTALQAIQDGTEMTQAMSFEFLAKAASKTHVDARGEDNSNAGAADGAASGDDEARDRVASDLILAKAAELCGVDLGVAS